MKNQDKPKELEAPQAESAPNEDLTITIRGVLSRKFPDEQKKTNGKRNRL